MFKLLVNEKEYKVRFSYGALIKEQLISKLMKFSKQQEDETEQENVFEQSILLTAEFLLVGLQKHHSDEFGYNTDAEKEEKINKVYDLMDEYEEKEDHNALELFEKLQEDLFKNGFLSQAMTKSTKQEKSKTPSKQKK